MIINGPKNDIMATIPTTEDTDFKIEEDVFIGTVELPTYGDRIVLDELIDDSDNPMAGAKMVVFAITATALGGLVGIIALIAKLLD